MTIEDRIRKIALTPITQKDFEKYPDPNEYFYDLCVKAFNLGLEIAAEEAKTIVFIDGYSHKEVVDKESILKWKITT